MTPDRLTDERLEELERFALAMDRSDMRALIAELRALRRVAEALNWLLHLHHGVSKGEGEPSDAEWLEALREAEAALAERGGEGAPDARTP